MFAGLDLVFGHRHSARLLLARVLGKKVVFTLVLSKFCTRAPCLRIKRERCLRRYRYKTTPDPTKGPWIEKSKVQFSQHKHCNPTHLTKKQQLIWYYSFNSDITLSSNSFKKHLRPLSCPPCYRVFSLTWPASMQIYWNKRKRLHKKRVQLPQDWFGTPTWPLFHCFGTSIWPSWRHVKTLYS